MKDQKDRVATGASFQDISPYLTDDTYPWEGSAPASNRIASLWRSLSEHVALFGLVLIVSVLVRPDRLGGARNASPLRPQTRNVPR